MNLMLSHHSIMIELDARSILLEKRKRYAMLSNEVETLEWYAIEYIR
jgi:hypothetical protein